MKNLPTQELRASRMLSQRDSNQLSVVLLQSRIQQLIARKMCRVGSSKMKQIFSFTSLGDLTTLFAVAVVWIFVNIGVFFV